MQMVDGVRAAVEAMDPEPGLLAERAPPGAAEGDG